MMKILQFLTETAHAQNTLDVSSFGFGSLSFGEIVANVLTVLKATALTLCTTVFIIGAFFFVIYFENEEQKSKGKNLMFGSLTGVAVIFGAQAIVDLVLYFIYGQ